MRIARMYGFTAEEAATITSALSGPGWQLEVASAVAVPADLERDIRPLGWPCLVIVAVRGAADAAAVSCCAHLEPARLLVAGVALGMGRGIVAGLSLDLRGRLFYLPPEAGELARLFHDCRAASREAEAREGISQGLRRLELAVELPTGQIHVAEVAWFLTLRLADAGFCPGAERRQRTELALEEALLNAVEHGNLELDSGLRSLDVGAADPYEALRRERLADKRYAGRKVRITLSVEGDAAAVEVADDGRGISVGVASGIGDPGGRGMALIGRAFESVEHEGSTLTLRCRKEPGDAARHTQEG